MSKLYTTALLIGILFLGVCYGQERADAAKREVAVSQLKADAIAAAKRTAELTFSYARERQRGDSLQAIAAFAERRRDRAVASTDSVLTRVDSALADTLATPASTETDSAHLAQLRTLVVDLRASVLRERLSSDSAILSLSSALDAKNAALAAADSVILAQGEQLAIAARTIQALQQRPPWYRRLVSGATKVAIGVAIGSVVARLPY